MTNDLEEMLVEQTVTYSLQINDKFFLIENVPARINIETGEQYFSPMTVERLQQIILNQEEPTRFVETPVFNFAA
jgi:hypothetical protein